MLLQPKLQQKVAHKLILTPALQQAIKLLPLSTVELSDMLNQEIVENPMLEETPLQDGQASEVDPSVEKTTEPVESVTQSVDSWDDSDYEYFFGDYLDDGSRSNIPKEIKDLPPIENIVSTTTSLSDHLNWQVLSSTEDDTVRSIALAIIGNLDSDGYLGASVEELASMGDWSTVAVEEALRIVQDFDPAGVGARDLQECMLLQLRQLRLQDPLTERIVAEHLDLLERHKEQELSKKLGLSVVDVKHHIHVIQQLDPKPGSRYNPRESQYVVPDIYVVKVDDGYQAVLNEDGVPQLRISAEYRHLLERKDENNQETRTYVKERFRSALWLIKSVEQRRKTIQKVANSIIQFQRDFLDYGISGLRPLVLREVANDISMHESTVSRVVNNKYMHTPQGVFEMKFLFQGGFNSSFGNSVSSAVIKQRIQQIIKQEDDRKPLSDSKLLTILQKEGLVLARRTIAKYREELRIPGSTQRKVV
jgi:RNA polymerase sigma-54 factor